MYVCMYVWVSAVAPVAVESRARQVDKLCFATGPHVHGALQSHHIPRGMD